MSDKPNRPDSELYASLQNPDETTGTDTYAARDPGGHYVIIGRGPAAWFNHATLLHSDNEWGRKRLGKLKVMHIGFREYWEKRKVERMGQWPRMLDFFKGLGEGLGFENLDEHNAFERPEDWLPSDAFAESLQKVEAYLKEQYARKGSELILKDGFVGVIESYDFWNKKKGSRYLSALPPSERRRREDEEWPPLEGRGDIWKDHDCHYRISVFHEPADPMRGRLDFVYAHKIDICTGFGVARLLDRRLFESSDLYDQHSAPPSEQPDNSEFRRIIDGNVFIGSQNDPGRTVVVYKGNPVGAQSVQSALDMPQCAHASKHVWFMSSKALFSDPLDANVPGARNLLELIGATEWEFLSPAIRREFLEHFGPETYQYRQYNIYTDEQRRAKFAGRLFRGEHHAIKKISETRDHKIVVQFTTTKIDNNRDSGRVDQNEAIKSVAQMREECQLAHQAWPPDEATFKATHPTDEVNPRDVVDQVVADQLVYSMGQQNDTRADGSAAYLVQLLGPMRILRDTSTSKFPLGLTDNENDQDVRGCGCVRILGAAAARAPGLSRGEAGTLTSGHAAHGNSLPKEAPAGGGGMNVNFPGIWRANRMVPKPIRINFSSQEELVQAGLSKDAAQAIIAERSASVRGLTVAEIQQELLSNDKYKSVSQEAAVLNAGFTF